MRVMLSEGERIVHLGSWRWKCRHRGNGLVGGGIPHLRPGTGVAITELRRVDEQALPSEDAATLGRVFREAIGTGSIFENDHRVVRPDGNIRFIHNRAVPQFDASGKLVAYLGATLDITERKQAEETLKASLREKEVLLKEIHHRVKNNMQVMSSLVDLQADRTQDEAVRAVLQDVMHRVRSMALVHEKLYQSTDMARVEFAEYAQSLLGYLWRAYGTTASGVRLTLDLEPVPLSVNVAVPCGLILNELATNALKYAFRARTASRLAAKWPCRFVATTKAGYACAVRDNGVGLPPGLDWRKAKSLGLHLVQILAQQLHATVEVCGGEGTEFIIAFGGPEPSKERQL